MVDLIQEAKKDMTDARAEHNWKGKLLSQGGTGGGNVLTGFTSNKGVKAVRTYPCHNPIHGFVNASVLWSAFGYRTEKEVALLYHSWLINDSPWAKAGVVPQNTSPSEMFNEGFIFTDLDKTPANLLHNFLIATRMDAEWPALITAWYKLVTEHSVNHAFAFLMLTTFAVFEAHSSYTKTCLDIKSCLTTADKYDWPLDMARATEEYVLNFCNANPVGASDYTFFPTARTAPVNTLWGALVDPKDKRSYISILAERYLSLAKVKDSTSGMTGRVISVHTFEPKDVLSIILQEEERLFKSKKKVAL